MQEKNSSYTKTDKDKKDDKFIIELSKELNLAKFKIIACFDKLSIDYNDSYFRNRYSLLKDIVCSYYGLLNSYIRNDEARKELDNEIKRFDEIYIDTAPIIHEDWFLYFIANVIPYLRKRRKKLVVLEKTMEELYGISRNEEKDLEVRLRANVRPYFLRYLARKGLLKKVDTGSKGIADDHLIRLFRRRGKNKKILLITQDRYLSERVVQLGENLNRNIEIPHHSLFDRFISWKFVDDDIVKKVVACELLSNGDLLRLYICQHCGDSYYDKLFDCGGYVLCSSCYYDIERQKHKNQLNKEREEQKRLKEIKEIEEKRDINEKILTVGKVIKKKQRKSLLIVILILIVLVFSLYLFI
ncbi:MAG: hypothetical protein ACPKOI_07010 [Pleomorphochaeta sp.]